MNKFTSDNNIYFTNILFKEYSDQPELALYTTASDDIVEDGKTYISLRKKYLELEDPTEYEISSRYFDNWEHWKKVREASKIKPHVEAWREELEVKLRSKGIKVIYDKMYDGDYQASKWLAEKGWVARGEKKRGAPSAAERVSEARKEAKVIGVIDSHWERMNNKSR